VSKSAMREIGFRRETRIAYAPMDFVRLILLLLEMKVKTSFPLHFIDYMVANNTN
jgi:hypothetical protein